MLYNNFLKKYPFFRLVNRFYSSLSYIYLMAFMTFVSEVFSFEIPVYYFYVFFGLLLPALFCEDMKSFLAPVFFGYFSVSLKTNQGEIGVTLFRKENFPHLIALITLIFLITLSRILYGVIRKEHHPRPKLLIGYLLLALIFPLGGLFSPYYSLKNAEYGLLVSFSYLVPFLLSYYLVDYTTLRKDYFAHLLVALGLLLSGELVVIYITHFDNLPNGTFQGGLIRTGWGIKNNIGGMLALSIVGPFYLALKKKRMPFYLLLNLFFLTMVSLTESRGSLLVAVFTETILFITGLVHVRKQPLQYLLTFLGALLCSVLILFLLRLRFPSIMDYVISTLKHLTLEKLASGRLELWTYGISYFRENPILGGGYYRLPDSYRMNFFLTDFMPLRMHNTYIQLLSSTGIIGLLAYLYHRFESAILIFRRLTTEKLFVFFFYLLFLGCSAVDCHFFNIGPALLYSVMAAIAEGLDQIEESKSDNLRKTLTRRIDVTE